MGYRNSITLRFLILHSFSSGLASSPHFRFLCPKPRFSSITLQNRLHRLVFYFYLPLNFAKFEFFSAIVFFIMFALDLVK